MLKTSITFLAVTLSCILQYQVYGSGPKQCYSCVGDCKTPYEIEDCPSDSVTVDYVCQQYQITINNIVYERRGCVQKYKDTIDICNYIEESDVGSCSMCSDDLCNNKIFINVSHCYSCYGDCNTLSVEACPNYGHYNAMCMAFKSVTGNTIVERRGCYFEYMDTIAACKKSNELNNTSCYICEKDLCNIF